MTKEEIKQQFSEAERLVIVRNEMYATMKCIESLRVRQAPYIVEYKKLLELFREYDETLNVGMPTDVTTGDMNWIEGGYDEPR